MLYEATAADRLHSLQYPANVVLESLRTKRGMLKADTTR